jgi:hypothetical protein
VDNTLPPTEGQPPVVDNTLPKPPGQISNPIVNPLYWMVAYCPSLGWRYVVVDPSLTAGMPLPPHPEPKGY